MTGVPVKPEYRPTLPSLLAPRWDRAPRPARVLAVLAAVLFVALAVGLVLTLLNSTYSRGGRVPFHFDYRGLYRTTPEAGGYVRVRSPAHGAALKYSFAVNPLKLPAYRGSSAGEVPIFAAGLIGALRRSYPDFVLQGEGKSRLSSTLSGYQIAFTATVAGRPMMVREVLLVPERPGAREGLRIVMLTAPGADSQITSPLEIATTGVLQRPLKTFSFS